MTQILSSRTGAYCAICLSVAALYGCGGGGGSTTTTPDLTSNLSGSSGTTTQTGGSTGSTGSTGVTPTPTPTPTQYALTVGLSGSGTVTSTTAATTATCTSTTPCVSSYDASTKVTLTAAAASGYKFSSWGDACSGSTSCEVTMSEAKKVTANFTVQVGSVSAPAANGPLFVPAEKSGSFQIAVNCSADSAGSRKVSFGVPFPRGFLSSANQVRLETTAGVEVAADTAELARWHHISDTAVDNQSIRSVLMTFQQTCEASKTYNYVVRWGTAKTLSANAGITAMNVSSTWGAQSAPLAGQHVATDNYSRDTAATPVTEPYAWVSLPAAWLMKSNIRGPVSPITDASMKDWLVGFNKTYVNDVASDVTLYTTDGKGLIDWSTNYDAWLFDRPYALWNVYVQTGDVTWLRHAHRATQFYNSWVAKDNSKTPYQRGAFLKKAPSWATDPGDPKYSHAGGLFAAYLLTGDGRMLDAIKAVADFTYAKVQFRLYPFERTSGLWTERHLAAGIAGVMYAYEATGDADYKTKLQGIITGMQTDVDTPPAGYPTAAAMRGVLFHRPQVHDGDSTDDMIMSPWMAALLTEQLMHYYMLSDDNRALNFMSNYAQFVAEKGVYTGSSLKLVVPWYNAGLKAGYTDNGEYDDVQHAPDVMGMLARGRWARNKLGLSVTTLDSQIAAMRTSTSYAMSDAVRATATYPRYRASPTRRVGWWFGTNASLAWFGVQ